MIDLRNYKLVLLRVKATAWLTLPIFFFLLILHFANEDLTLNIIFSLTLFSYFLALTASFFNGSYYLGYLRAPYIALYILYGLFAIIAFYWLFTIGFDIDKNGSFTISDVLPSLLHIIVNVGFFVAEASPNLVSSISHFLESNVQMGTALLAGMIQGLFFAFVYGVRSFCLDLSKKYATKEETLIN